MKSARLAQGGDIDRQKSIGFLYEGRRLSGFEGDTLGSALIANNVSVVGRSFKYHRPRGILAAGVEEPNALMQVGVGARRDVNVRATEIELVEGLIARPVNCWPSARFDVSAVNNLISRFIPAGFYYKTFMWPDWHLFEPFIRHAAGLGRPSSEPDPDAYETLYAHTDILVVGAGPAGLAAARVAAQAGARVMLVEQDRLLGGALRWRGEEVDGRPGIDWASAVADELAEASAVRVLNRTTAIGYFDHNEIALSQRVQGGGSKLRLWRVRARRVILATGALERPLVFPGNDRPGVMLASGVARYLGQYAVRAGARLVLFANNDDAYDLALAYQAAGGEVVAIVDSRPPSPAMAERSKSHGLELLSGEVVATHGAPALEALTIRLANGAERRLEADVLAMSGGWSPSVHLFKQSGGALVWDEARVCLRPGASVQAENSVGAADGDFSLSAALLQGHDGAVAACAAIGLPRVTAAHSTTQTEARLQIAPLWRVRAKGKAFVDFQNDATVSDIELAAREGFVSIEHLKRYTTLGMAPDQGKTSNVNALAIMAEITGRSIPEVGTTGYRFPYTPTPLGAFAGRDRGDLFRPLRRMPAHACHEKLGAVFEEYGGWTRPAYYPRPSESAHQAEQREALAVRTGAGLFEGSPLGKIEVKGPDAAKFIDRIYANTMSTLKIGKLRYGLMLNEFGVAIDDGVAARLGEDHFLVGTTSSGGDRIAAWLEEWLQCEWIDLDVIVAPVTTAWGVITLTGPRARDVLKAAGTDIDLAPDAFPHMSFREGLVSGFKARVFRVSYTGEVSFEINVAAHEAESLWTRLFESGAPFGLTPIGIDAWMLLRTEKGFLHIGADTDGTTTALDVGWDHVLKRKSDFIGRRSLTRPADQQIERFQFVGLEALDSKSVLTLGAHMRKPGASGPSEGYVTSSGFSPVLKRGVALGMVKAGRARLGETLELYTKSGPLLVRITKPGVYDPDGALLDA